MVWAEYFCAIKIVLFMVTKRQQYYKRYNERAATETLVCEHKKQSGQIPADKRDIQGNPVDEYGQLIVEKVSSIEDVTDNDFKNPARNILLPKLPINIDAIIGARHRTVVIKRSIFMKNLRDHKDVVPDQSRDIIMSSLLSTDIYGQNQKKRRPFYWVLISIDRERGKNKLVLLDVNPNKECVEIVHWHYINDKSLETIKRQAAREDGQLLILPSYTEEVGGLSDPTNGLSDGKGSETNPDMQEKGAK